MAYRKSYRSKASSKANWSDAVPRWRQHNTDTCNLLFKDWMSRIGVTDIHSYFDRLAVWIWLCVASGAVLGAYLDGWSGIFWYGVAGLAAPAAIPYLFITVGVAILLALAYVAVWAALIFGVIWLLGQ